MFLPQTDAIWQLYSFKVKQKIPPDDEPIWKFHKIKVRKPQALIGISVKIHHLK